MNSSTKAQELFDKLPKEVLETVSNSRAAGVHPQMVFQHAVQGVTQLLEEEGVSMETPEGLQVLIELSQKVWDVTTPKGDTDETV